MKDDILSDEDKHLFHQEMQTVTPLKKNNKHTQKAPRQTYRKKKNVEQYVEPPVQPIYLACEYTQAVDADSILSYMNTGFPRKRFQQLKKGKITRQARLDLHGLAVDAASDKFRHFIQEQLQNGTRCLLIIHGKGGSTSKTSIMKSFVNHWLRQLPQTQAFHSALPQDGGHGATYVLLKNQQRP